MPKYNITVEFEGENPASVTTEILETVSKTRGKLTSLLVTQTEDEKKNNIGFQVNKSE